MKAFRFEVTCGSKITKWNHDDDHNSVVSKLFPLFVETVKDIFPAHAKLVPRTNSGMSMVNDIDHGNYVSTDGQRTWTTFVKRDFVFSFFRETISSEDPHIFLPSLRSAHAKLIQSGN